MNPEGQPPPYENSVHLVAQRLTYDENVGRVVLQLEYRTFAPSATGHNQDRHEVQVLTLLLARIHRRTPMDGVRAAEGGG